MTKSPLAATPGDLIDRLLPTADEAKRAHARALAIVLCTLIAVVTPLWIVLMVTEPELRTRNLIVFLFADSVALILLEVNRRGGTRLAGRVFIATQLCAMTVAALYDGGVRAQQMVALIVLVVAAGVLLGEREGMVTAAAAALATLVLTLLETSGRLPAPSAPHSAWAVWLRLCMFFALALMLQRLAAGTIGEALRRSETEVEERRRVEQRLVLALRTGNIGVWEYDPARRRFTADETLFDVYGVPLTADRSIAYETWVERVFTEDADRVAAQIEHVLASGTAVATSYRVVRPDGKYTHIETSAAGVFGADREVIGVVGVSHDATERREAQRERERLVHVLGERVKELRLLHDVTRLLQPERPFEPAILAELAAMIPPAWQFPECCEARIAYLGTEASTPGWRDSPWKQSARFRTDDGAGMIEVVYLQERPPATEGPFLAEERSVLDSMAELLVTYLELRRHQEGLEALVEMRTQELSVAIEGSQAAYRAKSAFLANMSHEIRTPMNAILGFGQLMERDASLSAKNRERLQRMMVAGEHLLELINNVLEMSRAEAGRVRLVTATFDLPLEVTNVTEMIRQRVESKGLAFRIEGVDALPRFVSGDAGKLRQILINLLANAAKFTDAGTVTLRASSVSDSGGALLTFEVQDTGPGIEAAELDEIFEPFAQAELGATSQIGTGLGLPISRDFARLMGGDLTLRSVVGEGSVFRLVLRVKVSSAEERRKAPREDGRVIGVAAGQRPVKVMIADDTEDSRVALRELLLEVGVQVLEIEDGSRVVPSFLEHSPDFVFTDWRMPGMDGLEAVRRLRATEAGARVPIVVLSASVLEDERAEALQSGATDFLPKPYKEQDIWRAIERHLGLRFVRTSDAPGPRSPPSPSAADLAGLGVETLRGLSDALERGDTEEADHILAEAERSYPDVVAPLRTWLDEFAIDRVRSAIDQGLTGAASSRQT